MHVHITVERDKYPKDFLPYLQELMDRQYGAPVEITVGKEDRVDIYPDETEADEYEPDPELDQMIFDMAVANYRRDHNC